MKIKKKKNKEASYKITFSEREASQLISVLNYQPITDCHRVLNLLWLVLDAADVPVDEVECSRAAKQFQAKRDGHQAISNKPTINNKPTII